MTLDAAVSGDGTATGAPAAPTAAKLAHYAQVLRGFTDLHVCVSDPRHSLMFCGESPTEVPPEHVEMVTDLLRMCQATGKSDFMLTLAPGETLRGRLDTMPVDSNWYKLRVTEPGAPSLGRLPSKLPAHVVATLLSKHLCGGGLVYVMGAPAQGKTTTGSATVADRLRKFGGVACTLENPPEKSLNGWHGPGYCYQGALSGDSDEHWEEAFRTVLRGQPAGSQLTMYIGEVRDGGSARAMLKGAANGFLVIATGFGTDIPSGLNDLCRKASGSVAPDASTYDLLATTLRLVVYQEIRNESVRAEWLASHDATSSVANRIRTGQFVQLGNDITFQRNAAMIARDRELDLFEVIQQMLQQRKA